MKVIFYIFVAIILTIGAVGLGCIYKFGGGYHPFLASMCSAWFGAVFLVRVMKLADEETP